MPRWIAALLLAALIGGGIWYALSTPESDGLAPTAPSARRQPPIKPEREYTDEEREPQPPRPAQVLPPYMETIREATRAKVRELIRPCLTELPEATELSFKLKVSQYKGKTYVFKPTPIEEREMSPSTIECIKGVLEVNKSWDFDAPDITFVMRDDFSVGEVVK